MKMLQGYKTYLAVAGLIGLAIYQVSLGEYHAAAQSALGAAVAFGLRSAVSELAAGLGVELPDPPPPTLYP